jgi:hypothetical protein
VAGIANVTIKIGAETADAVRNIGSVNTALAEQSSVSQKASAGIKKAAVPAAAAFGLVTAAAFDFTKAAAEDHDAQVKLAGQLQRTTGANADAVKGAEDYITSLSGQVAIADDELRPALGKLAAATGSVTDGQKQLAIAADIAAQAHVPLETAVSAVAKADQGHFGALQKLVPGIDAATIATKDQTKIVDAAAKLTQGAATESAKTYEGQQKAMKIQIDETKEAIGAGFLPVMDLAMKALKRGTDFAAGHEDAMRLLMIAVAAVSGAILAANAAMKLYEASAAVVKVATGLWTAAQWLLNAALDANPIGAITVAVGLLAAGIVLAYKHSDTFRTAVNDVWAAIKQYGIYLTPMTAAFKLAQDAWAAATAVFEAAIKHGPIDALKDAATAVKDAFHDTKAALVAVVDYLGAGATSGFNAFKAVLDAVTGAVGAMVGAVKDLIGWIGKIKFPSVPGFLKKLPGSPFMVTPPAARSGFAYATGANTRGVRAAGGVGAAGGVTVNVYGAVDPEGTARAIQRMLAGHARRQGRAA